MIEMLPGAVFDFFDRSFLEILRDVLDVALVAYLIYRVLALLKGTRAMQMAIGLALVFLTYQAARQVGLLTLWTLLDTLLTYIVLLVVVIFQHDIRRALMRVGRQPLFRSARLAARESKVIEETTRAAKSLAQRRIGALIVFERAASLDEFIEPGVELDAEVSRELLTSIFIPSFENPMHDGAVIVREGRVWLAGAVLPLSTASGLDRALGTRHRAALGITEETDAVAVVVSEERGSMTVCFEGNLVRDLDTKSLERVLRSLLQPRARRRRGNKPSGDRAAAAPPTAARASSDQGSSAPPPPSAAPAPTSMSSPPASGITPSPVLTQDAGAGEPRDELSGETTRRKRRDKDDRRARDGDDPRPEVAS